MLSLFTIKSFTDINNSTSQQTRVFFTLSHFYPGLIVAGKGGANNRLGWKRLRVTNTLAYFDAGSFTAVAFFLAQSSLLLSL